MTASPSPIRRSIRQTFDALRPQRRVALMPFIPAGYPDLATTVATLKAIDAAGASLIEVGFPFSDPIADGPTIQAAFSEALKKKIKVGDIFGAIKQARPHVASPMVAMVSYSIVFRYDLKRFCADAKSAGFDGLILPDLPPPEAQTVCKLVQASGLDTNLLVAPSTAPERRREIAELCSGFVYYLSVSGITGERDKLPADLTQQLRQLKEVTDRPLCVGFGIHTPQQVAELGQFADGAIVGSAIVRRMTQHVNGGPAKIASAVGDYCKELLSHVAQP